VLHEAGSCHQKHISECGESSSGGSNMLIARHQPEHTCSTTKKSLLITKMKVYCVMPVTLTIHPVKVMKVLRLPNQEKHKLCCITQQRADVPSCMSSCQPSRCRLRAHTAIRTMDNSGGLPKSLGSAIQPATPMVRASLGSGRFSVVTGMGRRGSTSTCITTVVED